VSFRLWAISSSFAHPRSRHGRPEKGWSGDLLGGEHMERAAQASRTNVTLERRQAKTEGQSDEHGCAGLVDPRRGDLPAQLHCRDRPRIDRLCARLHRAAKTKLKRKGAIAMTRQQFESLTSAAAPLNDGD